MPPFNTIKSLELLSLEFVYRWVMEKATEKSTRQGQALKTAYIKKLIPPKIRQQIIDYAFQIHMYSLSIGDKLTLLGFIGDSSTHLIDFSKSGYVMIDDVFAMFRTLMMNEITNFTHLGFDCRLVGKDKDLIPDVNSTLHDILQVSKNLTWLTLIGLADKFSMYKIGEFCHRLEHLDIQDSHYINDEGIAALILPKPMEIIEKSENEYLHHTGVANPCAKVLKYIRIGGTQTTMKSTILLLRYCPNLKSFGDHTNYSTSLAIAMLYSVNNPLQLVLEYLSDSRILPEHVDVLEKVCPNLGHITIAGRSLPSLAKLHPLKKLNVDLEMGSCCNEIFNYLTVKGEFVTELILNQNFNTFLDLPWLVELTPNLQVLHSSIEFSAEDTEAVWQFLISASISFYSSDCLIQFAQHAPAIEELNVSFIEKQYMETASCISDELVANILNLGGFSKLKRLIIKECSISIKGVENILLHCSYLEVLGHFQRWEKVNKGEIQKLRTKIQKSNWNLKSILYEHEGYEFTELNYMLER